MTEENLEKKLLVVDDDNIQRMLHTHMLKDTGYHIITAEDGQEGFEAYKKENPDIVITDKDMPNMDGIELIEAIRTYCSENPEYGNTPVIMVSGNIDPKMQDKAIEAGVFSYLAKPTSVALLKHTVSQAAKMLYLERELRKTKELATHDALTGLPNRRYFDEMLERTISTYGRRAKKEETNMMYAAALIDLDDFKGINDTYGHNGGDDMLCEVARRLKKALRRKDDVVARFGGDEFAAIIGPAEAYQILETAKRMNGMINDGGLYHLNGESMDKYSVSIGIAIIGQDGKTAKEVMDNADKAAYSIKKNGKNGFAFYEPDMKGK